MVEKIPNPPSNLPEKQRAFFIRYFQTYNAYQSAVNSGYADSTARKTAYLWVGKNREKCPRNYLPLWDAIYTAQEKKIETIKLSKDFLLTKLMELAGFSLQDIIDPETGRYLPLHELPPEAVAGIETMSMIQEQTQEEGEDGRPVISEKLAMQVKTIRASDRIKAIELLGKYMRYDPTVDYKSAGPTSGGGDQKTIIKNIFKQIAGKTRGLPKPVYDRNDDYGGEE